MSKTDNWKMLMKIVKEKRNKKKDNDFNNYSISLIGTIFKPPTPKLTFRELIKRS